MSTSRRSNFVALDLNCPECRGTRQSPLSPTWVCRECDGTGYVSDLRGEDRPVDIAWAERQGWCVGFSSGLTAQAWVWLGSGSAALELLERKFGFLLRIPGSGWQLPDPTRGQVLRLVAALKGE